MKTGTVQILAIGLLPWAEVWLGSYALHRAVASFVFYHLFCITTWMIYRRRCPFQGNAVAGGLWIVLAGVAAAVIGTTYFEVGRLGWLIDPVRIHAALLAQHIGTAPLEIAALFAYFALVNPIAEELFWRRTIYLNLRGEGSTELGAVLASSLLFGSWHWLVVRLFFPAGWAIVLALGIAVAGAIFAKVFESTRSVVFTVLLHALAADIPILLALWLGVLAKS